MPQEAEAATPAEIKTYTKAMVDAIRANQPSTIKATLAQAKSRDIKNFQNGTFSRGTNAYTFLLYSVYVEHPQSARALLLWGADPNGTGKIKVSKGVKLTGVTPLMIAVKSKQMAPC